MFLAFHSSEQSTEEDERKHERKSKKPKSDMESESEEDEDSESDSSQSESEESESEAEVKKKKKVTKSFQVDIKQSGYVEKVRLVTGLRSPSCRQLSRSLRQSL